MFGAHELGVHAAENGGDLNLSFVDEVDEIFDLLRVFIIIIAVGGARQPFANLPDTFDGPTKVGVALGVRNHFVNVRL